MAAPWTANSVDVQNCTAEHQPPRLHTRGPRPLIDLGFLLLRIGSPARRGARGQSIRIRLVGLFTWAMVAYNAVDKAILIICSEDAHHQHHRGWASLTVKVATNIVIAINDFDDLNLSQTGGFDSFSGDGAIVQCESMTSPDRLPSLVAISIEVLNTLSPEKVLRDLDDGVH